VQVIREHPRQPNLLFVGTEFGAYFTIDGGAHWTQIKSGIPGVPVHDLQIQSRANDLVAGTHGRGIYILDDLTPLENLAQAKQATVAYLFPVQDALLFQPNGSRSSGMGTRGFSGQNPEAGPHIAYTVGEVPPSAKVSLTVLDASGAPVRALPVSRQPGLYRISWDMRVGPPLTGPIDTLALANGGRGAGGGRGGRAGGFGAGGAGAAASGAADSAGRGGRGGPGGAADSTAGGRGGAGGFGGGRGGADGTFPALPGRYIARLSVTSAEGAATILDQPFALTKDPMVILSDNDLKQLYAFRLGVVKLQRDLRERQAQLDTAERTLAAAKRAADSAGTKVSPELKAQIAAVDKELTDVTREMGATAGGRGGAGRGGAGGGGSGALAAGGGGGAGGGRGGRGGGRGAGGGGGAAAPTQAGAVTAPAVGAAPAGGGAGTAASDQDQNPTGPVAPENIQARLGTTTELLNSTFNPNPEQKRQLLTLPADLQKQGDRVKKVSTDQLPALLKALKDAGVDVKTP
jgi:hypothetical protein